MPNSDPLPDYYPPSICKFRCGGGLGLGNHKAISTRGVIIWQGVENWHEYMHVEPCAGLFS